MKIKIFSSADQFLEIAQPMLEAHETRNNLIMGVAIRMVDYPGWIDFKPYLALVYDESNNPVLSAIITPPKNVLLAVEPLVPPLQIDEAILLVVNNLIADRWPVPGVNAEDVLSNRFAQTWTNITGQKHRVKTRLRAYELRKVNSLTYQPPGNLRLAIPDDLNLVTRWHHAFTMEAIGDGVEDESRKLVTRIIQQKDVYLWQDGLPVSMAYRARPTPHGYTVTGVYTPPEHRRRGYGSACVAGLSQLLLNSGKQFCNLFTDLANPTSNSIYQKIGYKPICNFLEITFVG